MTAEEVEILGTYLTTAEIELIEAVRETRDLRIRYDIAKRLNDHTNATKLGDELHKKLLDIADRATAP